MLFCGIDLHSNNCLVVVSDDADKVVYSKRLPNDLAVICDALSPYQRGLCRVVDPKTEFSRKGTGVPQTGRTCAASA